jgi:hypothetical protein
MAHSVTCQIESRVCTICIDDGDDGCNLIVCDRLYWRPLSILSW